MMFFPFSGPGFHHHPMHRGDRWWGGGGGGGRGGRGRGGDEAGAERGGSRFGRGRLGRGGGGGAGRVFGPGDLRLVLLAMIAERPRHGYELIKELEVKFGGGYAPSPGSVYPTLMLLEELDYIRASAAQGNRKLFEITAEGRAYLRDNQAALDSALARMEMAARAVAGEAPPEDLHHAVHTLKAALMFHRGGWSDQEVERVRKIIETAAAAITRRPDSE